jgi:hypothetical protein
MISSVIARRLCLGAVLALVTAVPSLASLPCVRTELHAPGTTPLVAEEARFVRPYRTATEGDLLLVADLAGLKVFDLADPSAPVQIGALNTPGVCWDVAVSGDVAYLADEFAGLAIVDLADPTRPHVLATQPIPGLTFGVDVAGDLVACAAMFGGGLFLVDVSEPAAPVIVGSNPGVALRDVVLTGGIACAISGSPTGLMSFDVSDPVAPQEIDFASLDTEPRALAVNDGLVCVAMASTFEYAGGMAIGVLSGSGDLAVTASLDLGAPAHGASLAGNLACVGAGAMWVFDVSSPGSPVPLADVGASAYGTEIVAQRAILASGSALQIHDLTSPSDPVLVGEVPTTPLVRAVGATDGLACIGDGSLQIYTLEDPAAPQRVAELDLNPLDLVVSGERIYAAGSALAVVDAADPADPLIVHEAATSTSLGIALHPDGALLCTGGTQEVAVYDLADPDHPQLAASWAPDATVVSVAWCGDAVLTGRNGWLDVHDASDLDAPLPLASVPLNGTVWGLAVQGSIAVAATADASFGNSGELRVLDLSDPAVPVPLGVTAMEELTDYYRPGCLDVVWRGSYAYVAADMGGVVVVDLADPSAPTIVGRFETAGDARRLALGPDWLAVADTYGGLVLTALQCEPFVAAPDISLPSASRLERPFPNPFNPVVRIPFVLARSQVVSLSVYDAAGRHVCDLARGQLARGRHVRIWRGRDAAGRAMASGVYHVRLEADGSVQNRRIVLVR